MQHTEECVPVLEPGHLHSALPWCRGLHMKEAMDAEQALLASTLRAAELAGVQHLVGSIR